MAGYHEAIGEPIESGKMASSKARELALALGGSAIEFASLVGCHATSETDIVIFDAEVELPQRLAYPILPSERLAVLFDHDDVDMPEVLALREGFPWVPHVNLRDFEQPRSLCLYDERYRDIKRRWTAPRFVEQIRDWLALTAKGKLHQDDQPLEPLMFGHVGTIVLPSDLLDPERAKSTTRLTIHSTDTKLGSFFLLADRSERRPEKEGFRAVASVHRCEPQRHGIIRHRPGNVKDLAGFVSPAGLDLLAELRSRLGDWKDEASKDPTILDSHLALIVVMPKTRSDRRVADGEDIWAFLSTETIRESGRKLGLWQLNDGVIGYILGGDTEKTGEDIRLDLLNPCLRLTRSGAAALNGLNTAENPKIAAIGTGALGSQVAMNLARGGFGTWVVIDDDRMLPHNAARHALDGRFIGYNKAEAIAYSANSLVDSETLFTPIVADVLEPGDKAVEVKKAMDEASLILDMSASVTVARLLALQTGPTARRASLFLTPSGEDLVLLAEDRDRTIRLDSLEMQYYRALAVDERLAGHFKARIKDVDTASRAETSRATCRRNSWPCTRPSAAGRSGPWSRAKQPGSRSGDRTGTGTSVALIWGRRQPSGTRSVSGRSRLTRCSSTKSPRSGSQSYRRRREACSWARSTSKTRSFTSRTRSPRLLTARNGRRSTFGAVKGYAGRSRKSVG